MLEAIRIALIPFWAALGAAVGSFLNLAADRLPARGSLLWPPSRCDHCGHRLTPVELIPIVSYLALRGRCRACGARYGARNLAVELLTAGLFALAAWRIAPASPVGWATLLATSASLAVLILVSVTDVEHGLILNRAILPAMGLGLAAGFLAGWPGLLRHLGAGLLGAGLIAAIIALVPGGMGWGDAKLAAFVGLVTGLPGMLFALFTAFVSGGLAAAGLLVSGRRKPRQTIPLGPFLALGGAAALLYGEAMRSAFVALARAL